ncbi:uncharacterized protein Tco025E_05915 [Trypanosoma conorhini]|uniref:Uncharacterized protein n=1 Tax=Trypanosoma conorhini TaxID=83891 RepID=A0A422P9G2_9TRYP|nr:uncharacterized protein Tco025E_05915 [Trypanosoma conorhini]RNF14357.1 hypothetical protein Tco025E_05915 [Trypanosoma conorhini]
MNPPPGPITRRLGEADALLFARGAWTKESSVPSSDSSPALRSERESNSWTARYLHANGGRQQPQPGETVGSDPCRDLIGGAAEIRRRVHCANIVTARLRVFSRGMLLRQSSQQEANVASHGCDDEGSMLQSNLCREFEAEFAAALELMRSLRFFGALTAEERAHIPVTRAAFIASRKNMVDIQINQQSLLSRQLSVAWEQHYRLCKTMLQKERDIRESRKSTSLLIGRDEAETSSLWSKRADDFAPLLPAHSGEHGDVAVKKLQEHMNALRALLWDMQRILATQQQALQQLGGVTRRHGVEDARIAAKLGLRRQCGGKHASCGCCSIM